jgi:hypothetical protein
VLTPSPAYTKPNIHREYSIHRVQHPPKIVCLHFILMIRSWPLNVASASGVHPFRVEYHQPAYSPLNPAWKWVIFLGHRFTLATNQYYTNVEYIHVSSYPIWGYIAIETIQLSACCLLLAQQ